MVTWMFVREGGVTRVRALAVLLSLLLAAVMMITLAEAPAAAAPSVPTQAPDPSVPPVEVTEAADIPSARATARMTGRRIEALSERTESTTTFVNPDGSVTADLNAGPIRVRRGEAWMPVDLTLVRGSDGVIRPRSHPRDLALAGGGFSGVPRDLARVQFGESEVALQWRGRLPEPVLSGSRAVYPDVLLGADLVVQATRTGFEQYVIVKSRPLASLRLSLPLRTKGVTARRTDDGNTELVDNAGAVIGAVPATDMWDANVDAAAAVPTRRVPVAQQVTPVPDGLDLVLTPDPGFFTDPATRFPVTIDPAVSVAYNTFDTFTQSGFTTDQSTSTELRLGTYNGGTSKARTYIHFPVGQFIGKRVLDAKLWLYATHSYSCSARNWEVWDTALVGTGTRWTNQPAPYTRWLTTPTTRGNGVNCDDAWISSPVTNLVTAWSNGGIGTGSMVLKAENETDSYGWKKFSSGEGGAPPHLEVTYNTRPNPATGLAISDRGDHGGAVFTRTTTPTLSFRPTDPDGDSVTAVFNVYTADGTLIHDQWVGGVPSGSVATWKVPPGLLQAGQPYRFRATTFDSKDFADDAWLVIRSVHSGQVVDVNGCGYANGTRVQQWPQNGADCQRFFPWGTGDGHYQFKVRHSGQVLDNTGCSTANANPVTTYNQVSGDCQKWAFNRLGGGVYSFTVRNAGKVMDQGCSTTNGQVIYIWQRFDNACQRFRLDPAPANGVAVQWLDFTIDTTAPGAPQVSSTDYPADNLWHGAAGQAGNFTFAPPAGTTDTAGYLWGLDATPSTEVVAGSDGRATAAVTPAGDGHHVLNVRTKDRAGHMSGITSYAFQVGRAGLVRPSDGARIPRRTVLEVDAHPDFTHVRYIYRRGEGAAVESDIPAANLTAQNGTTLSAGFVPLSTGPAVWNAVDTVGASAGVVQVKAVLATDASGTGAYSTAWRTLVIDPDADGAATAEVGPGSVNLLTGDYSLGAEDVDEFGLTVSRTSSSRDPRAGYQTQRERLTANQQKISTDATGFLPTSATVARVTTGGHTGGDSLQLTPDAGTGSNETYAAVGAENTMALGMRPGRTYRLSGWIFVPATTGLTAPNPRGLRLSAHYLTGGVSQEAISAPPTVTGAWQQLSLDFTVPEGATQAFVRINNGFDRGSGKPVFFDDLSLRELTAPFGPAWSTGIAADAAGVDYTRLDFEADTDNTVVRIDTADGGSIWFTKALDGRFFPEPGAEDLTLAPEGANYRLTELDGTVTVFAQQAGSSAHLVSSSTPPTQASATRYGYEVADDRLRIARVIAPTETGVGDCTLPTPARGCRVLQYSYAAATTATPTAFGDVVDQVRGIALWSTDPATGAVSTIEVARYSYDDQGRLREVWDPRITPALKTGYDYDPAGRVITATPPGELAWRFDHAQAGPADDPNPGRLTAVRRAALAQGSIDQLDGETATTVVYGVPLTRAAGGPHDLNAAAVASWAQTDAPTDATAVFPPQEPATVATATATAPGSGGYRTATVHYLDGSGRAVNVAEPGGWIDTKAYDRFGNVTRELSARNRAIALAPATDARVVDLDLAQADPATRATRLDTQTVYSPDGLDELRETSPLRRTVLPEQPDTTVTARAVTEHVYDEGKPDGAAYHLATTTLGYAVVDGRPGRYDPRLTKNTYAPVIGGASGWTLRQPTQVTTNLRGTDTGTDMAAGGDTEAITTRTRYDDRSRVLEVRSIDATGTDARTVLTDYWTAQTHPTDAQCGGRPEWAGALCTTRHAGAITGHDNARMTGELPVERVTAYARLGGQATVTETAAASTRTTTTNYDAAGRTLSVAVTGGLGTPVPAVTTSYDPATGRETSDRFPDGSAVSTLFDRLGRQVRYTDADGGFTATEFDRFSQVVRTTDSTGAAQTMVYDRATEPRGLLTRLTDSIAGSFDPVWDVDEQMTELAMPGGVRMTQTTDPAGIPVTRTYTTTATGAVIASSAQTIDVHAQRLRHVTDTFDQRYTYDSRRRLIRTSDTGAASGICSTRVYTLDNRSNRFSKTVRFATTAGICPDDSTTPTSTTTHTHDTADRAQDPGLRFDPFGRITNLATGADELVNTFYTNDLVASQTEADQRQTWTLDPSMRFRSWSSEAFVNGNWANAVTKVNHYGDDTDEPRWIVEDATLPDNLTRNISGPDGQLAATTSRSGDTTLQLTSLHGDVMAALPLTASGPGPVTLHSTDEFGIPQNSAAASSRYSWLGAHQRSGKGLDDTILMGARLYHPTTGRFLSVDPEPGGSATAYDYGNHDPVNTLDLDGQIFWVPLLVIAGRALVQGCIRYCAQAARSIAPRARAALKIRRPAAQRSTCRVNSFAPETPVLMDDGKTLPINMIREGDMVAATNPTTGETTSEPVLQVIIGYGAKVMVDIDLDQSARGTLRATDGHQLWTTAGWRPAAKIDAKDTFVDTTGGRHFPLHVVKHLSDQPVAVYNLSVANTHTFTVVVDNVEIIAHNCSLPASARNAPRAKGVYVLKYNNGSVYVGRSGNIHRRLHQHMRNTKYRRMDGVVSVRYHHGGSRGYIRMRKLEQGIQNRYRMAGVTLRGIRSYKRYSRY